MRTLGGLRERFILSFIGLCRVCYLLLKKKKKKLIIFRFSLDGSERLPEVNALYSKGGCEKKRRALVAAVTDSGRTAHVSTVNKL